MSRASCLVLVPDGSHCAPSGESVDFSQLYERCILPATQALGLDLVRPALAVWGQALGKEQLQTILGASVLVADLTLRDPAVMYQLGLRHAGRPGGTLITHLDSVHLPFENSNESTCVYHLSTSGGIADLAALKTGLVSRLRLAQERDSDSLRNHRSTEGSEAMRLPRDHQRLTEACRSAAGDVVDPLSALAAFENRHGARLSTHADLVHQLLVAYRGNQAWPEMTALFEGLPERLKSIPVLREQYAIALNRSGESERAEGEILALLNDRGASGETYGVLGRLYKDQWEAATWGNQPILAGGFLDKAIDAYLKGFETDWRDPYTGVNAATLMEIREPPDARLQELLPVVTFAARRRVASGRTDYWGYATLLEAAVLSRDRATASTMLVEALRASSESWQPKSTARNLRLIREARQRRKDRKLRWAQEIEEALDSRAR